VHAASDDHDVERERAPLSADVTLVGVNDFTTPSRWRTKLVGGLLVFGPGMVAVVFLSAFVAAGHGPVGLIGLCTGCVTASGIYLLLRQPILSDRHIVAIAVSGSIMVGLLELTSKGQPWLPAFPLIYLCVVTLTHLFLQRRMAVAIHVFVLILSTVCTQIISPSLRALFERDLITAAWAATVGWIVSLIRRRLDRSTVLLFEQANRDVLTGLSNRLAFATVMNAALTDDNKALHASVFVIDLDRFKAINDTMGHAFGDAFLRSVATRLQKFTATDDRLTEATIARLGGDEFAVFVPLSLARQELDHVEDAMRHYFHDRFTVDGINVGCEMSIGSASYPLDGVTSAELLHQADVAMYQRKVKRSGRSSKRDETEAKSERRSRLLRDLDRALEDNELELFYQPKVVLADGSIESVEALLRWKHREFGYVPPDEFVPLAEGTGFIIALTTRVLQIAAVQSAAWSNAGLNVAIAVNVSARSLIDRELPTLARSIFELAGADIRALIVEVTETTVMADVHVAKRILEELRTMGVRLSIDDFGTGYSSLAYLRDLAVDELKIDRSFVADLHTEANEVIVRAAIQLAHNLGLAVVAEGVEDTRTLSKLRSFGCDVAQGHLFSVPMRADDATRWIRQARLSNPLASAVETKQPTVTGPPGSDPTESDFSAAVAVLNHG
jgi:diguanylate cyclase (GGDEF)-like protein